MDVSFTSHYSIRRVNEEMADEISTTKPVCRFLGSTESEVDEKYRITVPAKYRNSLGKDFVVVLSKYYSLYLVPKVIHDNICDNLEALDPLDPDVARYKEIYYPSSEEEQNCDQQGRLVIPAGFRESANLAIRTKVHIIGTGRWVEIWNSQEYQKFNLDRDHYNWERASMMDNAYKRIQQLNREQKQAGTFNLISVPTGQG